MEICNVNPMLLRLDILSPLLYRIFIFLHFFCWLLHTFRRVFYDAFSAEFSGELEGEDQQIHFTVSDLSFVLGKW